MGRTFPVGKPAVTALRSPPGHRAQLSANSASGTRAASILPVPHLNVADHERTAHACRVKTFRAMTPQRRLRLALQMNATMRGMLAAGFRLRQPTWTSAQIQQAVADRILHARTG